METLYTQVLNESIKETIDDLSSSNIDSLRKKFKTYGTLIDFIQQNIKVFEAVGFSVDTKNCITLNGNLVGKICVFPEGDNILTPLKVLY